jgi:hypothetical protein
MADDMRIAADDRGAGGNGAIHRPGGSLRFSLIRFGVQAGSQTISTLAPSHPGVATVILGVKNRVELRECLAAAERGPLDPRLVARIDAAVGRP